MLKTSMLLLHLRYPSPYKILSSHSGEDVDVGLPTSAHGIATNKTNIDVPVCS
jgi:hypothetical protein